MAMLSIADGAPELCPIMGEHHDVGVKAAKLDVPSYAIGDDGNMC
jgi:hypothetical protein